VIVTLVVVGFGNGIVQAMPGKHTPLANGIVE
jgi:hypothetical protein